MNDLRTRLTAALVALALMATACGGSETAAPETAAPETVVPEVATPETATPAAATPDESGAGDDASGQDLDDCAAFPSFSEGSFYVPTEIDVVDRPDLADGVAGVPLTVRLTVVEADTCTPFGDQLVEIWGAGVDGRYSGVATQPDGSEDSTLGESWLRGRLTTGADGVVEFATVVPGWIPGQAPHLHVSAPVQPDRSFTARLVFPDEVTSEIYAEAPYAPRGAAAITVATEATRDPGVERSVLSLVPTEDGYSAEIVLAIAELELREPPLPAMVATEAPSDDATDVLIEEPTRNFDQIGGELQEMFNRAGADLGVDPERLYAEFRFVTSDEPPDIAAIAERLDVSVDALALALPLLAGGAPTPAG